ncbi:MAG: aminotransferase class V-fold PLP-dependent enzyme [Leadbetterella sp.]
MSERQLHNFYPGPSTIYPFLKDAFVEAYECGILEANHRSTKGEELVERSVQNIRKKLLIPTNYEIFYVSSATEAWEISAQSLFKSKIQFLYSGAFGKKWFKYAVLNPHVSKESKIRGTRFDFQESFDIDIVEKDVDTICLVSTETSNGSNLPLESLKQVRQQNKDAIICVDATSGLGGVHYDYTQADFWFASVQKCLGQPAGLGVLIVSPQALKRAKEVDNKRFYNSLGFIHENFAVNQTHYTPNMLGIYCLDYTMQRIDAIDGIAHQLKERAEFTYNQLSKCFQPLVQHIPNRSHTVLAFEHSLPSDFIQEIKSKGFILGKGYGEWKDSTFRVANFPAIEQQAYNLLLEHCLS